MFPLLSRCPVLPLFRVNVPGTGLPETMASVQVPLIRTLPSGQVHLAPAGLRRHMKSQDILRHGFDAVEKE